MRNKLKIIISPLYKILNLINKLQNNTNAKKLEFTE